VREVGVREMVAVDSATEDAAYAVPLADLVGDRVFGRGATEDLLHRATKRGAKLVPKSVKSVGPNGTAKP
jgi:hypothetical protein